ncbi:hypothetical protein U9M48_012425 [Paspalum notatum var. saurae]|uniref:DUF4371 domain-containing protein n=1 Tax=Paspalum notatum var. saurae TaxID=547442 RepID=A0AAQ3SXK7_PASNO
MKRKTWDTPDLRSFLARAAKNQSGQESVAAPSFNERELQMVIYQERTSNVPPEPKRVVPEPPIVEDEDSSDTESVHLDEIEYSDEEDEDDIYGIEHDSGNFEEVNKVVLGNAPQNCQLIDHKIQKQFIGCCAQETTKFIIEELGDECFAILADESSDAYQQEQLALCLCYVNKIGEPIERFLGLVKVEDTTFLTLKEAIQSLLIKYQLPLSKIRGQGYDGASNMKGHVNGLKKLAMEESHSAYYVHCFAHQLQLTLVAVAKENIDCAWFFGQLVYLLHVLGMSF